jgi:Tol biopolymer transport system component
MMRARTTILVITTALIAGAASACTSNATVAPTPSAAPPTAMPSPPPTSTPAADAPMPRHVTFAPGETIAADGQTGIFFLDPKTGAADAWLVPAATVPNSPENGFLPFAFTVGGFSADGGKVVYTCTESKVNFGPVPCGGAANSTWYLLDTKSGERTRLEALTGPFLSISPDGKTLLGATAEGFALAAVKPSDATSAIASTATSPGTAKYAEWSPDGSRLVLTAFTTPANGDIMTTFLVDATSGRVTPLDGAGVWSPDGARLMVWRQVKDHVGELHMLDRDGRLLWSKASTGAVGAGAWSADGSLIYAQVLDQMGVAGAYGALERVDIIESATGATAYRIRGGTCPLGWAAGTHRLLAESYGFGEALVDLDAGSVRLMNVYARPTPFDPDMADRKSVV